MTEEIQGVKKIRLRRLNTRVDPIPSLVSPEEVIQKNLQPLLINTEKKKRAQEIYYEKSGNSMGTSPMVRNLRKPVRQRLGRGTTFSGTNPSMIPPKRRLRKVQSTLNNSINEQRTLRRNYAQMRMNTIRARQQQELDQQGNLKKVRLRKIGTSSNLRIEVRNNNVNGPSLNHSPFRHRQILNSGLQAEIRKLQQEHISEELIFHFRFSPVTTKLSMNSRFGTLF